MFLKYRKPNRIYIIKFILMLCIFLSVAVSAQDKKAYVQDPHNFWAINMTVLTLEGNHYAVWSGWDDYYENAEPPIQRLYIAPMTFHKEKPCMRR